MKVKVGENLIELSKKTRVVGGEAPSLRLKMMNEEVKVCGMMADKIQIFFFFANILDCDKEIKQIFDEYGQKTYIYVISSSSASKIASVVNKYDFSMSNFSSEFVDSSSKLGVNVEDRMCANAIFVINKDGEFTHIDIADDISNKIDLTLAKEKITEAVNFKKKGHTHENWMGV